MWVNVESIYGDGKPFKLNLGVALSIEEYFDRYEINYPGEEGLYRVKKTPEMVEAYNSLVPEKVQPVVPAEPDPTEWVTYMDADGAQYRIQGRRMPPMEVEPEWVVQDKVPYRHGIDQRRWVIASTGETHCGYEWGPADCEAWYSHGEFLDNQGAIQVHLRCRPDQLPKLDEPFRITGLGLYETASGQPVQVISNDGTDPVDNAPWFSPQHGWYKMDGTSLTFNPTKHIVKLIKLDEVQP